MSRGVGPEFKRTDVPPLFAETLLGALALILQLLLGASQLTNTHVACLFSVIHAGQKCSQFCGIGRSWMLHEMLHELCLELVPQQKKSGRKTWRTRRLKLDCAVQHCFVVFTSQPASVQRCVVKQPRAPRNWAHWLVHHFFIHSSPWMFRSGSTRYSVGAMSKEPMMPDRRSLQCCAIAKTLGVTG